MPPASEPLHDPESWGALNRPIADGRRISAPIAPQKRVQVPVAQAPHGFGELALEGEPPLLAVGDYRQAHALLEPDGVLHGPVFDGLELGTRDPARGGVPPRRNEPGRAPQPPDAVCVARDHGLDSSFNAGKNSRSQLSTGNCRSWRLIAIGHC